MPMGGIGVQKRVLRARKPPGEATVGMAVAKAKATRRAAAKRARRCSSQAKRLRTTRAQAKHHRKNRRQALKTLLRHPRLVLEAPSMAMEGMGAPDMAQGIQAGQDMATALRALPVETVEGNRRGIQMGRDGRASSCRRRCQLRPGKLRARRRRWRRPRARPLPLRPQPRPPRPLRHRRSRPRRRPLRPRAVAEQIEVHVRRSQHLSAGRPRADLGDAQPAPDALRHTQQPILAPQVRPASRGRRRRPRPAVEATPAGAPRRSQAACRRW